MVEQLSHSQIESLDRAGRKLGFASTMRNQAAAQLVELHPTDWLALDLLDAEGQVPVGELGRSLGLSRSAATALVDRLEAKSLVARQATDDRRVVVVVPTEGRGPRYDALDAELRDAMALHCRTFNAAELKTVLRFVTGAADVLLDTAERMRHRASDDGSGGSG